MQILCIGDVVGSHGCDFLRRTLPDFKRTKGIDVVIANGENSSDGNGITHAPQTTCSIAAWYHTHRKPHLPPPRILRLYR